MNRLIYLILLFNVSCTSANNVDLYQQFEKRYLKLNNVSVIETEYGNIIKWGVEGEYGVIDYTIEKSTNGKKFEVIGTVTSKGDEKEEVNYSFIDPDNCGYCYYRVILKDKYGYTRYSCVTVIKSLDKEIDIKPIFKY